MAARRLFLGLQHAFRHVCTSGRLVARARGVGPGPHPGQSDLCAEGAGSVPPTSTPAAWPPTQATTVLH